MLRVAVLATALQQGFAGSPIVLTSNLALPQDGSEPITTTRWLGSKFSTDATSYLIDAVTLRLQQTAPGSVQVMIFSDAGGRPGEMMASLSPASGLGGGSSNVTFRGHGGTSSFAASFTPAELGRAYHMPKASSFFARGTTINVSGSRSTGLGLEANQKYWVVTRALSGQFTQTYTDKETGDGVGYSSTWAHSENAGANWTTQSTSPLQLEVVAFPAGFTDEAAIASAIFSGLPMAMAQREAVFGVVRAVTRDVNERLFRLRAGPEYTVVDNLGSNADGKSVYQESKSAVVQWKPSWEVFATAGYGSGDNETILPAAGFQTDTYSGTVGLEYRVTPHFTLGAAFTYVHSDNSMALGLGDVEIEGEALAAYASFQAAGFYADFLYGYGSFEHDITRDTLFGETARAEPNSRTHTLQLNLGYNFEVAGIVTGPFASLDSMIGELEEYQESGAGNGSARLRVPGQNFDSLISRIGWQISRTFTVDSVRITPQLRAGWAHEYRDSAEPIGVGLITSPFYTGAGGGSQPIGRFDTSATGKPPGTDSFEVGFGLSIAWGERFTLLADYGVRLLQSDAIAHVVSLTGAVKF
jgi:hypothetical protein